MCDGLPLRNLVDMIDERWSETPASWALRTQDLWKLFGRTAAVAGLDLNVPLGGVHGLLGPNGSGKTTTLRMLMGLIRASRGRMEILGQEVPKFLPDVIDDIGSIVESPKFNPTFTLRRNLEILALSIGVPKYRVTEVLLEVGLGARAETRFQRCSLGMKQRLAIAATLLKGPRILIFDEPTNGLDSAGIQEIRATMQDLAAAGRTVLVSSHILSEIEQVADSVSIIGRGRVLAEGHLSEFLSGADVQVLVEVDSEPGRAHEVLRQAGLKVIVTGRQLLVTGETTPSAVAQILGEVEIWPSHLSQQKSSLEQVFLALTADEHLTATQGRAMEVA